jgi:hypothetical protein
MYKVLMNAATTVTEGSCYRSESNAAGIAFSVEGPGTDHVIIYDEDGCSDPKQVFVHFLRVKDAASGEMVSRAVLVDAVYE